MKSDPFALRSRLGVSKGPFSSFHNFPEAAPAWLKKKVTDELLGVCYVPGKANAPATDPAKGFDCWGWVWFYLTLTGIEIPKDAMKARRLFNDETMKTETMKSDPEFPLSAFRVSSFRLRFLDVLTFKEILPPFRSHMGVMENEFTMLHCGESSGGVARAYTYRLPAPTSVLRLKEFHHEAGFANRRSRISNNLRSGT
jgi:hypothetical protein